VTDAAAIADSPPAAPPTLPREEERREVRDADALGLPLLLQGGEVWYVPSLPLSARGQRLGSLLDDLQRIDMRLAHAQRIVDLRANALDAADTEEAAGNALNLLEASVERRDAEQRKSLACRAEIAWHALRCFYRVSREESDGLVTQRHWPDLLAALMGQDTTEAKVALALDTLKRVREITGEKGGGSGPSPEGPFAGSPSSAGPAAS
jgi:hypothetical protein